MDAFMRDCIEIAVERLNSGALDRRTFLAGLAALGVTPVILDASAAHADAKEIVGVNWGGDALKYFTTAWGDPYTKDTGIKVVWDGTGPSAGKIKAMVESKNVTWDVCDSGSGSCLIMGKQGYLDEFDYALVDKSKLVRPQFAYKWGMANYLFSYVIAYDTAKFGGKTPKSWADFWNLKEFPGKRTMRKDIQGSLEAALMADGVPFDKIYPIDEARAFKKLKEIKNDTIFWSGGAESQQLIRDGEVTMGSLWNTRVNAVAADTNERITWTWNQGILCDGCWVVPKGNPAGKDVYKFIASTQIPERQIVLFLAFGNGPASAAAIPLVPAEKKRFDPGSNGEVQLAIQAAWYGENQDRVNNEFLDLVSS
ncbi:MAG: ABC transporter substrate-binding protein [Alphaproteobacteria bacterium]|nr:ABC transporter substrate-binding protein [Alphaproteobacteria bacterium]